MSHDGYREQSGQLAGAKRGGHHPIQVSNALRERQGEAIRALAQAGAKLDRLDGDRYDALTIAAVAEVYRTLALLLSLGASARQITSRLRRHGVDCGSATRA